MKNKKYNFGLVLTAPLFIGLTFGSLYIMGKIGDKIGFTMLVLPIIPILIGLIICKFDKTNNEILNEIGISLWMSAALAEMAAVTSIIASISNLVFGNAIVGLLIFLILIITLLGKKDTQK